jgi:hypothetical protein
LDWCATDSGKIKVCVSSRTVPAGANAAARRTVVFVTGIGPAYTVPRISVGVLPSVV